MLHILAEFKLFYRQTSFFVCWQAYSYRPTKKKVSFYIKHLFLVIPHQRHRLLELLNAEILF